MKFTKVFRGVPDGGIYPIEYQPGDTCPSELVHAASEADALAVVVEPQVQSPKLAEPAISTEADIVPLPASPAPPAPTAAATPAVGKSTRKKQ